MKCMISVDKKHINRVSDEEASKLYHDGWSYVSKSLWKEKVRDIEKPTEEKIPTKKKFNKMSKAEKRHLRKSKK